MEQAALTGQAPKLEELSQEEWLDAVRTGDESLMEELYLAQREEFLEWVQKGFELQKGQALEMYQQALVVFYEAIVNGHILSLQHHPETYVFDIARGLILRELKKTHGDLPVQDLPILALQLPPDYPLEDEVRKKATAFMEKLSEPGASILEMTYFRNLSVEQIARKLKYKSQEIIESQKQLCLKTLKYKVQGEQKNSEAV